MLLRMPTLETGKFQRIHAAFSSLEILRNIAQIMKCVFKKNFHNVQI